MMGEGRRLWNGRTAISRTDCTAVPNARTEALGLKMSLAELQALDDWRRQQEGWPTRSEAIRRLVAAGIAHAPVAAPDP
jgi:hypothetical protein